MNRRHFLKAIIAAPIVAAAAPVIAKFRHTTPTVGGINTATFAFARNSTYAELDDLEALDVTRVDAFDRADDSWKYYEGRPVFVGRDVARAWESVVGDLSDLEV